MTYQEFLNYDTRKFIDDPAYSAERTYMGRITAQAFSAITSTRRNYKRALQNDVIENGKYVIAPNDESAWLNEPQFISEYLPSTELPPLENLRKETRDFIMCYEKELKKFLKAIHKQYADIDSNGELDNYHSISVINNALDQLVTVTSKGFTKNNLVKAGFIDLRLAFMGLEKDFTGNTIAKISPNSYTTDMEKLHTIYDKTLRTTRKNLMDVLGLSQHPTK